METILLAGATGYLGKHILKELTLWGIPTIALTRRLPGIDDVNSESVQVAIADVTRPETLTGLAKEVDTVISTVGITRQRDGLSYMDVDYRANMNLLREAQRSQVRKFIYISVINGSTHRHLALTSAKEKFVDELKESGLDYTIIRPNGFYSDMKEVLMMARRGKIYLFGNGEYKLNPIHGADLAEICVRSISEKSKEITVGGPDILTHNEIAEMAFTALGKEPKISYLPDWTRRAIIAGFRIFTSAKTYGPVEFMLTGLGQDNMAPRYGSHRLQHFFNQNATLKQNHK
ncbi:SDR family oxidoreductase [Rhodohalobacter mucosus]|uniref:NAD-dependent dehydratase n=1 Tax=Rhodohalobacter mucosus TaxID=2079485 RepID=A0A316TRX7_9BACT|nr:SDR family oxidoreductase [Rhodohalobacter mucosus]PWN07383.1 NAD-dependent dehydratase [Rhodohalobacter mucosus]